MAVRLERAHLQLVSQGEGLPVVGCGLVEVWGLAMPGNFAEMVFEAATKALEDADISIKDIDNVVSVSSDFWDGRTISSMAISDASGAFGKDISTVEADGSFGALYGLMRILSGAYGTTMVVAHHKGTESSMSAYWAGIGNNPTTRGNPLHRPSARVINKATPSNAKPNASMMPTAQTSTEETTGPPSGIPEVSMTSAW